MSKLISKLFGSRKAWHMIKEDFRGWCEWPGAKRPHSILTFLRFFRWPEYRVVLGGRLKQCGLPGKLLAAIVKIRTRHLNLYIHRMQNIGAGFRIMHGYSTIVNAQQIGENCCVSQNVTIGWSKSGLPSIGDNVNIYAGAIVVGGIRLGDNCTIGAGAVVTKDVPKGACVVGNPAKVVE